jgi:hypothetical protein
MSRLDLHCVVCGRRQADGLISGAAWGRFEIPEEIASAHPGIDGTLLRACPSCVSDAPDWQTRVSSSLGIAPAAAQAQANAM